MIDFPSSWRVRDLGILVEILDSRRIPVSANERAKRPGEVPYYGATGQVGTIDKAIFDEPLVLLGEDGVQFFDPSKPKAYLIEGPAWVNNHAHVLRPRDVLDRKFLSYYLNAADYRGFVNGTTRLKLTQAAMRRIPIPLPVLAEQRRIVATLEDHMSRLDAAEVNLDRAARRLEVWYRRAVDTAIWSMPTTCTPVGELLREPMRNGRSDRAIKGGESGIRTLTLTAVTKNSFTEANTKLTVTTRERAAGLWLEPGDILVQRSNTPDLVGTSALYTGAKRWAIFPDLLIRLRADESKVDPRFLIAVLRSERSHSQLRRKAKGLAGSMPKIDQKAIADVPVPVPDHSTQRQIVERVERVAAAYQVQIEAIGRTRLRAGLLRRSLLAAAFSGRLTNSSEEQLEALESV
ncbi:restriction endonuclease subunit S [Mycobacterium sp. ACS4331]|uniref:restriction endonuclease subunit S n=1 Tax=Mycobacterium sp. ACS4331 TaxID=1834121 RepID=UPI0009ED304D|nr:restriction endonuclease subunit S [Mycobacterium sp. ACS4331]